MAKVLSSRMNPGKGLLMEKSHLDFSPIRMFAYCALLSLVMAVPWFFSAPYHLDTFAGDDYSQIWQVQKIGANYSTVKQCFTQTAFDKYRPVASLAYFFSWKICGDSFRGHIIINILTLCLMAGGVGAVLSALGGGTVIGLVFAALFTTSRFAYYNVFMLLGIMESLALFLFSIAALWAVRFYRSGKTGDAVLTLVSFFLCIHTHERYVAVFPFLSLLFLLRPATDLKTRLELFFLPALVVLLNVVEKKYLFNTHFMTGTGGARIIIDYHTIMDFMRSGFYNVLGFNSGPPYLSSYDFHNLPHHLGYWPGVLISAAFAVLAVCYIIKERRRALIPAALFLTLLASLLLTSSMTIRQEFRWLFAPDIVMIAVVLGMAVVLWSQPVFGVIAKIALTVFFTGAMFANALVRQNLSRIYFMNWLASAESARSVIVEGHKNRLKHDTVYLINSKLVDADSLSGYSGEKVKTVSIRDFSVDMLPDKELNSGIFVTADVNGWQVVKVPHRSEKNSEPAASDAFAVKLQNALARSGGWYGALQVGQLFASPDASAYFCKTIGSELAGKVCANALAEYYLLQSAELVGAANPFPYFTLAQMSQGQGKMDKAGEYYCLAAKCNGGAHPIIANLDKVCDSFRARNAKGKK